MRLRRRKPEPPGIVQIWLDFAKDGVPVFYLPPPCTDSQREFALAWMRAVLRSPDREFVKEEPQG